MPAPRIVEFLAKRRCWKLCWLVGVPPLLDLDVLSGRTSAFYRIFLQHTAYHDFPRWYEANNGWRWAVCINTEPTPHPAMNRSITCATEQRDLWVQFRDVQTSLGWISSGYLFLYFLILRWFLGMIHSLLHG